MLKEGRFGFTLGVMNCWPSVSVRDLNGGFFGRVDRCCDLLYCAVGWSLTNVLRTRYRTEN